MYTCGRFISIFGKTNTILYSLKIKLKEKKKKKKIWGPEWDTQMKQTALLARPICIAQAQEGEETSE